MPSAARRRSAAFSSRVLSRIVVRRPALDRGGSLPPVVLDNSARQVMVFPRSSIRAAIADSRRQRWAGARRSGSASPQRGRVAGVVVSVGSSLKVSEQLVQLGWKVEAGKPKSEAGDRTIGLDDVTNNVLEAWRKRQIKEQSRPRTAGSLHQCPHARHLHQRVSAAGQRGRREGRKEGASKGQLTAVRDWDFSQRSPQAQK
jgi:hypothetical protein